jgi:broad specificity phosphatase PhoE
MSAVQLRPFVFIRHGETDWNFAGRFQGRTDVQLNETGRQQAREAGRQMELSSVSRILASPLQRAIETARLAFPSRLDLIEADELLIECDFGRFEGRPIKQVMQEHGITRKEQLAEILPEDGETWNGVVARCNLLLERVAALQETYPNIVMVGHDAVLQCISELLTGRWFDSKHGKPHTFSNARGTWLVESV